MGLRSILRILSAAALGFGYCAWRCARIRGAGNYWGRCNSDCHDLRFSSIRCYAIFLLAALTSLDSVGCSLKSRSSSAPQALGRAAASGAPFSSHVRHVVGELLLAANFLVVMFGWSYVRVWFDARPATIPPPSAAPGIIALIAFLAIAAYEALFIVMCVGVHCLMASAEWHLLWQGAPSLLAAVLLAWLHYIKRRW